jgi:hypothetical protein
VLLGPAAAHRLQPRALAHAMCFNSNKRQEVLQNLYPTTLSHFQLLLLQRRKLQSNWRR